MPRPHTSTYYNTSLYFSSNKTFQYSTFMLSSLLYYVQYILFELLQMFCELCECNPPPPCCPGSSLELFSDKLKEFSDFKHILQVKIEPPDPGLPGKHETLKTKLMLVECWPSVADGGPTFYQNWFNVSSKLATRNTIP